MNNGACNFNRHELVWLKLDAVKHAQYGGPAPMEPVAALSLLHRWVLGNYPLIVARQTDVPEGLLRIGLLNPHPGANAAFLFWFTPPTLRGTSRGHNLPKSLRSCWPGRLLRDLPRYLLSYLPNLLRPGAQVLLPCSAF